MRSRIGLIAQEYREGLAAEDAVGAGTVETRTGMETRTDVETDAAGEK